MSKIAVTSWFNIYQHTGFLLSLIFTCWFADNIVYKFAEQMPGTSGTLSRMSNTVTAYLGFVEAFMFSGCAWAVYCIHVGNHPVYLYATNGTGICRTGFSQPPDR